MYGKECKGEDCNRRVRGKDRCKDCREEEIRQKSLEDMESRVKHEEELGSLEIA